MAKHNPQMRAPKQRAAIVSHVISYRKLNFRKCLHARAWDLIVLEGDEHGLELGRHDDEALNCLSEKLDGRALGTNQFVKAVELLD